MAKTKAEKERQEWQTVGIIRKENAGRYGRDM